MYQLTQTQAQQRYDPMRQSIARQHVQQPAPHQQLPLNPHPPPPSSFQRTYYQSATTPPLAKTLSLTSAAPIQPMPEAHGYYRVQTPISAPPAPSSSFHSHTPRVVHPSQFAASAPLPLWRGLAPLGQSMSATTPIPLSARVNPHAQLAFRRSVELHALPVGRQRDARLEPYLVGRANPRAFAVPELEVKRLEHMVRVRPARALCTITGHREDLLKHAIEINF